MKKILLKFILLLFLLTSSVQAKTIKAISLCDFSTQNPTYVYSAQILERAELEDKSVLEAGTIITGNVTRVQQPQRAKRNGYFEFSISSITNESESRNIENSPIIIKVVGYKHIDAQTLVLSTAKKAVGFVFKGATQGISFVEGVAQAPEGEKLKHGLVKVYKDSPLSYIEVGKDLNIKTGDILLLKTKGLK